MRLVQRLARSSATMTTPIAGAGGNQTESDTLATHFKVMTFNLLMLNRRYKGTAASIVKQSPDVVAVQELSKRAAQAIGEHLRHHYPHQALRPARGFAGAGVFSRFPIVTEEPFRLSPQGSICQHVVIELPQRTLHFFNIHLLAPRLRLPSLRYDHGQREAEARALAQLLAQYRDALVVVGDFNMTDSSEAYRCMSGLLGDAFREAGSGNGWTFPNPVRIGPIRVPFWPVPFPVVRLDYIFHSSDLTARHIHCGDGDGSDHRPVIATLAFRHHHGHTGNKA